MTEIFLYNPDDFDLSAWLGGLNNAKCPIKASNQNEQWVDPMEAWAKENGLIYQPEADPMAVIAGISEAKPFKPVLYVIEGSNED